MSNAPLSQLGDYELSDKDQDIRGWMVRDPSGKSVGEVAQLIVDTEKSCVTSVVLDSGLEISTRDIELGDKEVRLTPASAAPELRSGEIRLPVIEERLRVSKRAVAQSPGVKVSTQVTTEPVRAPVTLREERVTVERQPADRPAAEADLAALREGEIRVPESAEVPIVTKEARVVGEVVIKKEIEERRDVIEDTVRRTEVAVETERTKSP